MSEKSRARIMGPHLASVKSGKRLFVNLVTLTFLLACTADLLKDVLFLKIPENTGEENVKRKPFSPCPSAE